MIELSEKMNGMVVGLKGNCKTLLSYAEDVFATQNDLKCSEEIDTRGIKRVTSIVNTDPTKMGENWQNVSQIVCIKRSGVRYKSKPTGKKKKKKESKGKAAIILPVPPTKTNTVRSKNAVYFEQTSYYAVVKCELDDIKAATIIKKHWGIEAMHRSKDVQYNEDKNKIKDNKLSPNLSQIFNFVLNIFTLTGQKSITEATEDLANRLNLLFELISTTNKYLPQFVPKEN
jgi:hypothetical protein